MRGAIGASAPARSPPRLRRRRPRATGCGIVARRSVRSTGNASSSGVPARPCRSNERAPSTSSPPPRSATNSRGQLELIAGEEVGFDVAEDDARRTANSLGALDGIAARQRRQRGSRPPARRTCPAHRRSGPCGRRQSTSRPGSRGQRALQERVLEARRAFDDQQPAPCRSAAAPARCGVLFSAAISPAAAGDLHGVDRRRSAARRHGEHLVDRRAVRGRRDAAHFDGPAVGADAQLHRSRAEAAARRRHAEVDRAPGQQRLARRQVDDLAIAAARTAADADGEHRPVEHGLAVQAPARGVAAVGQHDNAGHALVAIAFGDFRERRGQVAAPRGGGELSSGVARASVRRTSAISTR